MLFKMYIYELTRDEWASQEKWKGIFIRMCFATGRKVHMDVLTQLWFRVSVAAFTLSVKLNFNIKVKFTITSVIRLCCIKSAIKLLFLSSDWLYFYYFREVRSFWIFCFQTIVFELYNLNIWRTWSPGFATPLWHFTRISSWKRSSFSCLLLIL